SRILAALARDGRESAVEESLNCVDRDVACARGNRQRRLRAFASSGADELQQPEGSRLSSHSATDREQTMKTRLKKCAQAPADDWQARLVATRNAKMARRHARLQTFQE